MEEYTGVDKIENGTAITCYSAFSFAGIRSWLDGLFVLKRKAWPEGRSVPDTIYTQSTYIIGNCVPGILYKYIMVPTTHLAIQELLLYGM